jgi:periplasmic protein TonB
MFDPILSESTARTRRPLAVTLSFGGQMLVVGLTVLFPILRPEGILPGRMAHVIAAPLGITRESEPQRQKSMTHATFIRTTALPFAAPEFRQPASVPAGILTDESEPPATLAAGPANPGAIGGVPWGTGASSSLIPKLPPPTPAPAVDAARHVPVRVGGVVQAAKLVHQVTPLSLRVMSGHPWLAQAALDAVRQWVYRPTLLNGEPVEVLTQIDVNFKLAE